MEIGNIRNAVTALVAGVVLLSAGAAQAVSIPGLFDTGDGYSPNTQDFHYALDVIQGEQALDGYGWVTQDDVWPVASGGPWLANTTQSQWLTPTNDQGQSFDPSQNGIYNWTLVFDLTGFDPATATLAGQWATDNTGVAYLNGTQIGTASGFGSWATFSAASNLFTSGQNTLLFQVTNSAQNGGNPTGLRVEFTSSSVAPVPVPGAALLFGSALLGAGLLRRPRRRAGLPA